MLSIRDLQTKAARVDRLDIDAGEIVAVMGPSGSGKSLILRAIADLDPNDGKVTLDGASRDQVPAPDWRRRVGYLAAESGWWAETVGPHFTDRNAALPTIDALGFDPAVFSWSIARLSTGEKQRLALARLLAGVPRVLLLDEPTAALDPEATAHVEALLRDRQKAGVAILLVTHDRAQALRLATRHYVIAEGTLAPMERDAA